MAPISLMLLWGTFLMILFPNVSPTTISAFPRPETSVPLRSALNRDNRYGTWPNATQILYRIDSSFTTQEQQLIQQAMAQLSADMNRCIAFQQITTATGSDYLFISKTMNDGTSTLTCFSFPGRVLSQTGRGQKLALLSGPDGCMTVREIMKFLAHALGLRNEYNRPDRNTAITVFPGNIRPDLQGLNLLRQYTESQVDYLNTAFDYLSITIHSPNKYANPGTVIYSTNNGAALGTLPRLSQGDCVGLALLYTGCNFAACQDPYSAGAVTGAPVTGATATTLAGGVTATTVSGLATTTFRIPDPDSGVTATTLAPGATTTRPTAPTVPTVPTVAPPPIVDPF